jgi:membrane protein DedA with SNARE-associated domain
MFDWIEEFVEQTGVLGIVFLMFAENLFPPIPSELIMPFAGFNAAEGKQSLVAAIAAGTVGSLLGAFFWYGVGKFVGEQRVRRWAGKYGRWMTVTPKEVDRAYVYFHKHGGWAIFFGRLIPGIRTLISIPAGVADYPIVPFSLYTAAGSLIWTTFLVLAGYFLKNHYDRVADFLDPATYVVVALLVAVYVWRVVTFKGDVPPAEQRESSPPAEESAEAGESGPDALARAGASRDSS